MNTVTSSFSGPAPGTIRSSAAIRCGQILSAAVVALMTADGLVQLFAPAVLQADMATIGFPAAQSPVLGVMTLSCALVYAVPRSATLGAILLTGFLGGAIAMHFRIGEIGTVPQVICFILGAMAWAGLYLRDPRLRELLPARA